MQNDQSGTYRFNDDTGGATQIASPKGGDFLSSEASAADHYGHPDKCPVGRIFESRCVDSPQPDCGHHHLMRPFVALSCRKACYDAKVHRAPMKGILGTVSEGAYSIVMNDGYEDDVDEGDVVWVVRSSISVDLCLTLQKQLLHWSRRTGELWQCTSLALSFLAPKVSLTPSSLTVGTNQGSKL